MASLTGPFYVPAPNPLYPRYGLFRVATGPIDIPIQARSGGIQYELSTCDLPEGYEVECQESHGEKTLESGVTTVTGAPFIVYSVIRCSPIGLSNWGQERVQRFLYDQLVAGEQATVENIFSQQSFGQFPGLGNNPAVVNLGAAQGPVQAVSMLEDWLYSRYGVCGVIHTPMEAGAYLSGAHLLHREGNEQSYVLKTDVGTYVSIGNYAGVGPTGQAGTWLYITGKVAVYRTPDSQLFVPPMGQVINRSTNLLTIVMEREYVVTFDCHVAAVQVTLDTTDQ